MRYLTHTIATTLLALGIAAADPIWIEAEDTIVRRQPAVTIVDDSAASGGKALHIPHDGVSHWNIVHFSPPKLTQPGRYRLTTYLRVDQLHPIGKAWRIDLRTDTCIAYDVAYGLKLQPTHTYQPFTIDYDLRNPTKAPAVYMRWADGEGTPTLHLDRFSIEKIGDLPPLEITTLATDRVRYHPGQPGTITVTIANHGPPRDLTLHLSLQASLAPPQPLATRDLTLPTRQTRTLTIPFTAGTTPYGYGLHAQLTAGTTTHATASDTFCVSTNPWATAVAGNRDRQAPDYIPYWHHRFYSIGATQREIIEAAQSARNQYVTIAEFFSWSPGECFDMAPTDPLWLRSNGGNIVRSKQNIQREVAALQAHGIACITYVAYQAMGPKTIDLIAKRPEWFAYSPTTGDHIEFYDVSEWHKFKTFWKSFNADPMQLKTIGYFVPNYARDDVVDYCADQVIASTKMFNWDGLRWDCGHLNPGPIWGDFNPQVDLFGKPLAATPAQLEARTIHNLKRLKSRIRSQFPNFAIGTNFGSTGETARFPDMVAELCRDGGWLLDEVSYNYNEPTSPYHWWDKYYQIMAQQGEHITSLGGHYHPFAFNRNGGKYPVDRIYETILATAGKGHLNHLHHNSRLPFGNHAQFSVRFGKYLFDNQLRRVDNPQSTITIAAHAPLWWQHTVQRRTTPSTDTWVIHLINPPVADTIESDPTSQLPAPLTNIAVTIDLPPGRTQATAHLLTAEALRTGQPATTRAIPLQVTTANRQATTTIPEILLWKVLVWEFK